MSSGKVSFSQARVFGATHSSTNLSTSLRNAFSSSLKVRTTGEILLALGFRRSDGHALPYHVTVAKRKSKRKWVWIFALAVIALVGGATALTVQNASPLAFLDAFHPKR